MSKLRSLADRRVAAVAGALVVCVIAGGLAVGWGWWRYTLPDPARDVPAAVRVFASGQQIAAFQGDGRRAQQWVPLERIPRVVVDAVLAAEDRRFFEHPGVDVVGVGRALTANLKRADVVQGGSTVTQQLARTLFLDKERSYARKLREARIALLLEWKYGKRQILEAYLNTVYMGHDGDVAVHGVGAASRHFVGRDLAAIRAEEAAFLAAAIRAPNRLLTADAEQARQARNRVLRSMTELGTLPEPAASLAMSRPIERRHPGTAPRHAYFVDVARDEILRRATLPPGAELRMDTSLDLRLQAAAEAAVRDGLEQLERRRRLPAGSLQAAVVAIEPRSGQIRAMVGGRRYADSQFNRATRARRQPGSLFKPFVYLAAFEAPVRSGGLTPASVVQDEPIAIRAAEGDWTPRNIDGQFQGPVTVRRAIEQSLNVPAARVAQGVGLRSVVRVAHAVGVESQLVQVPSLALGSSEVTLLEMTSAFGTLANGGVRVAPTTLDIESGPGPAPVLAAGPPRVEAVSPASAFVMTHVLRGVMRAGTGAASARYGLADITAGKTGTTNDLRDAWFVGYTPDLAIGVWVGMDDGKPIGLTGSEAALPIWATIMQSAVRRARPRAFAPPAGVVMAEVDRATGRRATAWCGYGEVVTEAFREGTEPRADCVVPPVVAAGAEQVFGWVRQLFRADGR